MYELTESGRELGDVLLMLGRWGVGSSAFAGLDARARPEWTVLSLKARYRSERALDGPRSVELRFGDEAYALRVSAGGLAIDRGAADDPDLVVSLELETFHRILRGEVRARDAVGAGVTIVHGSQAAVERFVRLFT